jgi:uncharacterized protein
MKHVFSARHLQLLGFARDGSQVGWEETLSQFERLMELTNGVGGPNPLQFSARATLRFDASGQEQLWLHLAGAVTLPLVCQRCLRSVDLPVNFARDFRFVGSEDQAQAQDEHCEEDLLVMVQVLNLQELVEDELLLALPPTPMHAICPEPPVFSVADPDFDVVGGATEKPFAVLGKLKKRNPQ